MRKSTKDSEFVKGVERALKRAAADARRIARLHGTPIYVWENGKVVAGGIVRSQPFVSHKTVLRGICRLRSS
jgi:hypothetical protein